MNMLRYLPHATLLAGLAFAVGLTFDLHAFFFLGLTVASTVSLVAANDYCSAHRLARVRETGRPPSPRNRHALPYAA
jgi:hypothetical protein